MTRPRLYLDVDGVLNAWQPPWGDTAEFPVTVNHLGQPTEFQIVYAPELLAALDDLRTQHDLELVWLTTWLEEKAVHKLTRRWGALTGGRLLRIPARYRFRLPHDWKVHQLLADQKRRPAPFIWADDAEVGLWGDMARQLTGDTRSLMLAPDTRYGLTPEHIAQITEFVTA